MISDGLRMLRNLRDMARNATGDLSRELGTDIQLEDLHPKAFIRKHLLSEEDEAAIRKPLQGVYDDLRADVSGVHDDLKDVAAADLRSTAPARRHAPPRRPRVAAPRASYDRRLLLDARPGYDRRTCQRRPPATDGAAATPTPRLRPAAPAIREPPSRARAVSGRRA